VRVVAKIVGTVFGAGYSPVAPGTAGSLVAVAAYWWLLRGDVWVVGVAAAATAVGVWAAGVCERSWGRKDPPRVCVDEFAGYLIAVAFLPHTLVYAGAAFFAFRFFDVVKPFPAGRSQRLPGGWGIMADDVVAAVYANLVVQAVRAAARALGVGPGVFL